MVNYKNKYKKKIEPKIYGLEVNDDLIYIGKTHVANADGELIKSNIQICYANKKINDLIVGNNNVNVIELKNTTISDWYNDRNNEAHFKFLNGEVKLLNDPWILNGKRSYWDGKVKDKHTIDRLSESKHIKVIQYDKNGDKLKIWNSIKEVAVNVFKDYKVVNGSGCSALYSIINNKQIKNKFSFNSYWIKESDILNNFNSIPNKLNIQNIIQQQKNIAKKNRKYVPRNSTSIYSIYNISPNGDIINSYSSADIVAEKFNCNSNSIRRACRNGKKYVGLYWKYGDKKKLNKNNNGKFEC